MVSESSKALGRFDRVTRLVVEILEYSLDDFSHDLVKIRWFVRSFPGLRNAVGGRDLD
jgi:hypothetical protein